MKESNTSSMSNNEALKESHHELSQGRILRELIMGFRNTQLIAVAARLKLADHLEHGPKTIEHLSEITKTDTRSLYRLLRALASLGIFKKNKNNTFSTTPLAELLCDQRQGSLRNLAILYGEEWLQQAYSNLAYSVESGKPAFDFVHHKSLYDYLKQHPPAAEKFNHAMSAFSDHEGEAIKTAYNFSSAQTVIDIGGGQGVLLASLLSANPHLSGIVFELPELVNSIHADSTLSTKDLKISYLGGDFFKRVPEGGDIYLLKNVLHNWDDSHCITILKNCRKVMHDNSRLLIIERIIPFRNERSEATLFDINMLVVTGGQARSEEEYDKLFDAAGFKLHRVIPTQSPVNIVEGLTKNY